MSHKCHSILGDRGRRTLAQIASVSAELTHGHLIPEHSHPEDQLLFASTGVMTLRTRQAIWVVPPMRAMWIPADTPHSVTISGNVSIRTHYLVPTLCHGLPARCFVMSVSALMKELILHACRFSKLRKKRALERRIVEVLVDQLREAKSVPLHLPHLADHRAKRVMEALMINPGDQRTLEKLCKDCGASKRTVQRLFLEETKMTFARWRQQLRLLRGTELLATGETVTAAALEAGYSSTSAFISMFRNQMGTTPARYLKGGVP